MENNYIVTTTPRDEDTQGLESLSHEVLHGAGFDFNQAFYLRLSDHQVLLCDQPVRIMPRKRMVVFGRWQGKPVVAKLFFEPTSAKRHFESDARGVKLLQKNKIPTPELYYEGHTSDHHIYVLIFARIEGSVNLEDLYRSSQSIDDFMPILEKVVIEIATQHVLGLLQKDLHLRNFLLTEQTLYTLDGAQIEDHELLLSKSMSLSNLALFLSQLGINVVKQQQQLFEHYAKSRGWSLKEEDYNEMARLIQQVNYKRWKGFAKKIFRNSSHFAKISRFTSRAVVNRYFQAQELNTVIDNPEYAFRHPSAKILKAGHSATVIKVTLDGRDYVVKRYNIKNTWHRLRRLFRSTRAVCSWRIAQKCYLFNVQTAVPVACIEYRCLGIHGTSYYISQYISGEHAGEYFLRHFAHPQKTQKMISRISGLLKSVANIDMTHGDLKITNILIDHNEEPVLIDLDGAKEHDSEIRLRKAWKREIKRFLANFKSNPVVFRQFEMEFEKWS